MKKLLILLVAALAAYFAYSYFFSQKKEINVLVFSKTEGFRHQSIPDGRAAIMKLGQQYDFSVDTTEDASIFKEKHLKNYNVVIFLSTTGDVLNGPQQLEMNRFIQAGGGFVGIHAAADTEYDWPWYNQLVGAYFKSHPNDPNVREATIEVVDKKHPSTAHLPERWTRNDEWYNYKSIQPHINVLMKLDETSYEGGENGENHPIAWYHEFDGGRSFYTGLAHTSESFAEDAFLQHLWGGIEYAAGEGKPVDYSSATVAPEENRFQKIVLEEYLDEPMELEMLPDGRIIFVERGGAVKLYDPEADFTEVINQLPVWKQLEDGLLGMAVDPAFAENQHIFLFYSPTDKVVNRLSRFTFNGDSLALDSEKIVLEVETQRDTCCHSGGSVEFDANGLLYVSTGDNTNPHESDGYAPIDERAGRSGFDAQKSSANPNDLRGKILRIRPEADGTYSIPAGNLFAKDGSEGRPEIYVMGCRNPWRIAIDSKRNFLYWGDVGPDAGKDSTGRGSRGYDEVNQARAAGFFGWPYFIANNQPYHDYNFTAEKSGAKFNPEKPVNDSPNNTGKQELPPAQPAFIYYPYADSKDFPLVGNGGRNAMAGPTFYLADYNATDARYPEYYDGKLFTYDWMRGWLMAVTLKENGDLERMERFLPSQRFSNPTDIIFSPDGDMYLLEYGTVWFSENPDARLVHLKYIAGNREPVAKIAADKTVGAAPLTVQFSGEESIDYDGDDLQYAWTFTGDEVEAETKNSTFTFKQPGNYKVRLQITDSEGKSNETTMDILVGNDLPTVAWNIAGNQSFFFDNQQLKYSVQVNDTEDGTVGKGIQNEQVAVSIDFLEKGYDQVQIAMGHQAMLEASQFAIGKNLIENSDCKACHLVDKKSAGPSYEAIAEKYQDDARAIPTLAGRIIKGSGGVWGDVIMAAHPQLSTSEAEMMVKYILSLSGGQIEKGLPTTGNFVLNKHPKNTAEGAYILNASYTDKGSGEIGSLTARDMIILKSPIQEAIHYDQNFKANKMIIEPGQVPGVNEELRFIIGENTGWAMYEDIDLTDIGSVALFVGAPSMYAQGGTIEMRLGAPDGKLLGQTTVETTLTPTLDGNPAIISLEPTNERGDVYFVFTTTDSEDAKALGMLSLIEFRKGESL